MSLLIENIIPSDHGRIFGTNANTDSQMTRIKGTVEKVDGVKGVIAVREVFPREFIVHTTKLVKVTDIEDAPNILDYIVYLKAYFQLLKSSECPVNPR